LPSSLSPCVSRKLFHSSSRTFPSDHSIPSALVHTWRLTSQGLYRYGCSNLWSHILDTPSGDRETRNYKHRGNLGCCHDGGGSASTAGCSEDSTFQQHINLRFCPKCYGDECSALQQRLLETRRLNCEGGVTIHEATNFFTGCHMDWGVSLERVYETVFGGGRPGSGALGWIACRSAWGLR